MSESVDIERPATWVRFRQKLCRECRAGCCSLPVEVRSSDLVRMEAIDAFEADEPLKKIAKKLKKQGIIEHFHFKHQLFTLARMANGDCIYIDPRSRHCTIYERRPATCRNHPQIGPRPGFCAFQPKGLAA